MNRRGFLGAILATGVAPAVVGSGVLMPIRQILSPSLRPAGYRWEAGVPRAFGVDRGASESCTWIEVSYRDNEGVTHRERMQLTAEGCGRILVPRMALIEDLRITT